MTVEAAMLQTLDAVREAATRRGLTTADIARRVGVHERTIRRLLAGQTCAPGTLDRVARVLRVGPGGARTASPHTAPSVSERPVVGWEQAARLLGVSRWTLRRWRARRDVRRLAWWASAEECRAWARALVEGT